VRSANGTRSVLEPTVTQTSPAMSERTWSWELKSRAWLLRRAMWDLTASRSKPAAARSASVALKPVKSAAAAQWAVSAGEGQQQTKQRSAGKQHVLGSQQAEEQHMRMVHMAKS
jgi:hypothetical protein